MVKKTYGKYKIFVGDFVCSIKYDGEEIKTDINKHILNVCQCLFFSKAKVQLLKFYLSQIDWSGAYLIKLVYIINTHLSPADIKNKEGVAIADLAETLLQDIIDKYDRISFCFINDFVCKMYSLLPPVKLAELVYKTKYSLNNKFCFSFFKKIIQYIDGDSLINYFYLLYKEEMNENEELEYFKDIDVFYLKQVNLEKIKYQSTIDMINSTIFLNALIGDDD